MFSLRWCFTNTLTKFQDGNKVHQVNKAIKQIVEAESLKVAKKQGGKHNHYLLYTKYKSYLSSKSKRYMPDKILY